LIASSHPLFGQGLRSLLRAQQRADVEVVGVVANLEEATAAIERLNPDLVIVDYDDKILNRDEFLARFVEGEKKLRVVLLSLQGGEEALVYDRRTMAASEIDDWLKEWSYANTPSKSIRASKGANVIAESRRYHCWDTGHPCHCVINLRVRPGQAVARRGQCPGCAYR
jgi:chemotaxis response regulator CheB